MVIPYFLFVLAMASASQYPPWGPPNPYSYPEYYPANYFPSAYGAAHTHHVVHHKMHVHK